MLVKTKRVTLRFIAFLCVFSVLFSILNGIVFLQANGTEGSEDVIFESDYSTAIKRENSSFLGISSGDVFPVADPKDSANTVLRYRPSYYCAGQIILGSDYSGGNATIAEKAIKVEKGESYTIELDYYLKGESGSPGVKFGVAVGSASGNNTNSPVYSCYEEKMKFNSNVNIETGYWVNDYKFTYTVPENADLTNGDKLILYFQFGSTGGKTMVYVDNIKVIKNPPQNQEGENPDDPSPETGTVIFESDYSTAIKRENSSFLGLSSGDVFPVTDPKDSANTVLRYRPNYYCAGQIILGSDYSGGNAAITEKAIKVEKGESYTIELDYYLEGQSGSPGVKFGVAVGSASGNNTDSPVYSCNEDKMKFNSNVNFETENWVKNYKFTYTVPENADLTNGDKLILYFQYGSTGSETNIYVDNIKVIKNSQQNQEGENPDDPSPDVDTVIFESDYSDATPVAGLTGDDGWNAINSHKESSLAVFPYTNPFDSNDISLIKTGSNDYSAVYLGADYSKASKIKEQSIKIEPGRTYTVQFDYYAVVKKQNELPSIPLIIELAAGNTVADSNAPYGHKIVVDESSKVETVNLPQGQNYSMTTWKNETATITIPADLDITAYPYLLLNVKFGTRYADVYFDNVKVIRHAGQLEISEDNDYSAATVQNSAKDSIFRKVSGDFYPAKNPFNSNDISMKYTQTTNNRSMLFIGASYKNPDDIASESVTAKAGETYTIKFDYYIDGNVTHENGLKIGIGIGSTDYVAPNGKVSALREIISVNKNQGAMSGWVRGYTFTYTVPVGSTLSNGNRLFIYAQYGSGANLYIDNVCFKKSDNIISGEGDGTYRIKFDTNGGEPLDDIDFELITNNVVLGYRPVYFGAGQVIIGSDYISNAKVIESAFSVVKGATYEIEFDYYAKGNISTNNFSFGIAIGTADNHNTASPLYSHTEEIIKYASGQTVSTEKWVRNEKHTFKVPANIDLTNGDKLMLYFENGKTGNFNFYIDNLKVTRVDGQKTTVFETDYNETIPRSESGWTSYHTSSGDTYPKSDPLGGINQLPVPKNDNGVFVCWCVDPELLNPVNNDSFYGTEPITLYAKWRFINRDITINIDDCTEYWAPDGERQTSRLEYPLTITKDGNNSVLKYKMSYSKQKITAFDECQGETTGFDGAVIGLFDPNVFSLDSTAKPADAAYLVKQGETYYVSFKYKALSVDSDSTMSTRLYFKLGVTSEESSYLGIKKMKSLPQSSHIPDNEWKTAGGYVTIDDISSSGNRLSIFCYGYGEVLIDDIRIINVKNGIVFDTDSETPTTPIFGNVGDKINMPANPTRSASKFLGWYTDANHTNEYKAENTIQKGVKVLYAKFLTYQSVQTFENYELGCSDIFEHQYYFNKLTDDFSWAKGKHWLGSQFQKEKVRNGKASIVNMGTTQYEAIATLFDANHPLTVGEKYTISFWVNLEEMLIPSDIMLVFSNDSTQMRNAEWDKSLNGNRYETMISTAYLENHLNEWVEIRYDFRAKAPYVGISIPGLTKIWIDDACITLESADSSYERSIAGPGITYDELMKLDLEEETHQTVAKKIIIKPATSDIVEDNNNNISLVITVIAVTFVVIGAFVIALILIRKRKLKIKG